MKFITYKPIIGGDELSICRLYFDQEKLIWEQAPVFAKENNYKEPEIKGQITQKIVFKDISDFKITYLFGRIKKNLVNNEIPDMISISFLKDNKRHTFFFKIRSDFTNKKNLMGYFYEPL